MVLELIIDMKQVSMDSKVVTEFDRIREKAPSVGDVIIAVDDTEGTKYYGEVILVYGNRVIVQLDLSSVNCNGDGIPDGEVLPAISDLMMVLEEGRNEEYAVIVTLNKGLIPFESNEADDSFDYDMSDRRELVSTVFCNLVTDQYSVLDWHRSLSKKFEDHLFPFAPRIITKEDADKQMSEYERLYSLPKPDSPPMVVDNTGEWVI